MVTAGEPAIGCQRTSAPDICAADSSSAIRRARSATPAGVPSSSTATRATGLASGGMSSCTADGTSAEPAAAATAPAASPARRPELRRQVGHRGGQRMQPERRLGDQPQRPCDPQNSLPRS